MLRRAIEADAAAIAALVAAAYRHYVERIGRLPKPMVADQLVAVRDHQVLILVDGESGNLAGVLELIEAADHLFVENLAIYARRGYRETGRRAYLGTDVVELAKPIS